MYAGSRIKTDLTEEQKNYLDMLVVSGNHLLIVVTENILSKNQCFQ